jgi:RNA processing factor Prp31
MGLFRCGKNLNLSVWNEISHLNRKIQERGSDMEDETLPDLKKFLIKLLPVEPLAEAIEMLEDYASSQFTLTHGASMARLQAEISELDNQIKLSNETLADLKKQKNLIPKTVKKSNLINGGGNK